MIYCLMSTDHSSNCYIVCGRKTALIDSGINPDAIIAKIKELKLKIDYLINTHEHYDHIAGNLQVKEATGAKLCCHESAAETIGQGSSGTLSSLFGKNLDGVDVEVKLKEGDKIDLGDIALEVIHTPGHTVGGICLYEPASMSLFSGDTVFADGIGRYDFSGGSLEDLKRSFNKLLKLKEEKGIDNVYPGHGSIGCGEDLEKIYETYF